MELSTAQRDRACGVLLATAAGDALGAGYEFGPPLSADAPVHMKGGGGFRWEPGEWTDDTSMAIAIAEVAARGFDLREAAAQDAIVARWVEWSSSAADVGIQTRSVLSAVGRDAASPAAEASSASTELHERTGRTAGNGSLMRTAPVALAFLDDEEALVKVTTTISRLTHFDPEAGEACLLWCIAIRHAVLTGELDVRRGLQHLDADRRTVWLDRIRVAESSAPQDFKNNGWVVEALQGAWSAIATTASDQRDPRHLRTALEAAVRGGRDADTVAAIAGGLAGAAYGASAVPSEWRRVLHGWPGMQARDLVALVDAIGRAGASDQFDYTYAGYGGVNALARHPYDDKVWLGGIAALRQFPEGVTAVVSLCRVGADDVPNDIEHIEVRLIDRDDPGENPNLQYVLNDAVDAIERLRRDGHSVLVHCVQAHSRTPTVGALYGMRIRGVTSEQALADVCAVLPGARPIRGFRDALRAIERAHDSRGLSGPKLSYPGESLG